MNLCGEIASAADAFQINNTRRLKEGAMVAIVLAAGYATRLYPITIDTPKTLLKIGGKPILEHILEKIGELECVAETVIISNDKFYGHFLEWKKGYSANQKREEHNRADIIILNDGSTSEETRLGAIGDIRFAIEELSIDDEVMIIAGDNFFTYRLTGLLDFYRRMDADCIVVKKLQDREMLRRFGVAVVGPDFRVIDFEEKPKEPKSDLAVFATYIYKRDTLPLIKEYLDGGNPKDAPGNFPAWLYKRKRVVAYAFEGDCYDIGTPEAYRDICAMYEK